jgi:hypothetical protein
MFAPDDEDLRLSHHRRQEVMPGAELPQEFLRRIYSGVDLATYQTLGIVQGGDDSAKPGAADDQEVKVARSLQRSSSAGAVDERESDVAGQGQQRLANDFRNARGFDEQLLQVPKDRRVAIRLEVHLSAFRRPGDESHLRQEPQLPLHRAWCGTCLPGQLAQVEALVRMPVQPRE